MDLWSVTEHLMFTQMQVPLPRRVEDESPASEGAMKPALAYEVSAEVLTSRKRHLKGTGPF